MEYDYEVNLRFSGGGLEADNKTKAIRQIKAIFDDEYNIKVKDDEIEFDEGD